MINSHKCNKLTSLATNQVAAIYVNADNLTREVHFNPLLTHE